MPPSDDTAGTNSHGVQPHDDPATRAVVEALADCIRATLERGAPAEVPGLGTFRVEHHASQVREQQGKRLSVSPPRDTVAFEPSP